MVRWVHDCFYPQKCWACRLWLARARSFCACSVWGEAFGGAFGATRPPGLQTGRACSARSWPRQQQRNTCIRESKNLRIQHARRSAPSPSTSSDFPAKVLYAHPYFGYVSFLSKACWRCSTVHCGRTRASGEWASGSSKLVQNGYSAASIVDCRLHLAAIELLVINYSVLTGVRVLPSCSPLQTKCPQSFGDFERLVATDRAFAQGYSLNLRTWQVVYEVPTRRHQIPLGGMMGR